MPRSVTQSEGFTSLVEVPETRPVWKRNVKRTLARLRQVTLARFAADIGRLVRLHVKEPQQISVPARDEQLVVTLTTIPQRANRILPTLRSLLDQTYPANRIILAWPANSARTGEPYPDPPRVPPFVELIRCEDLGPATKLLPALRLEPQGPIVAVDDDVIYPRDFLETLVRAYQSEPTCAWGFRGCRLAPGVNPSDFEHVFATGITAPQDVDILLGTWGYLVPPRAFDAAIFDFTPFPSAVRWVDDVWFSGHLARRGVPRRVVPAKSFPIETLASFISDLSGGLNSSGANDAIAISAFSEWW